MTPQALGRPTTVFTPQLVATINRAYRSALEVLARENAWEHRARIADHMMSLARAGEGDEDRLFRLSVFAVLGHWPVAATHDARG